MLSTLLNYRIYANDISKSLERVKASGNVQADAKYYQDHIGKVETVDDFLGDYKLYTYALKAYGLEDQAASKGFIRKVIESDLTDSSSFANALSDDRYRKFASAFNFKPAGTQAVQSAQSTRQNEAVVEAYSEYRVRQGTTLAAKTSYFETKIATITSVDELLNDPTLFSVALQTIGADPALTSKSYVRDIFTGAVADDLTSTSDDKFFVLADRFNFGSDGAVPTGQAALSPAGTSKLIYDFNIATGNGASSQAAAHNTQYYSDTIGQIATAADLVNDPRLFEYVRTAFDLDSATFPAFIQNILTSDPNDPNSALNQVSAATPADVARKERLTLLRDAFNFSSDGSLANGVSAQDDAASEALIDRYYDTYQTAAAKLDASKTSTYKFLLTGISSVTDLLAKSATFGRDALDYVLKAFDLNPATESLTRIRRVLQSDTSDPNSYVNKLNDERYEKLAAAFNFGADGKVASEKLIQSTASQTTTGTRYAATFGKDLTTAQRSVITADTRAYLQGLAGIRNLDDLVASDKVVDYALKAYGLGDKTPSAAELKKILTSDLSDPKSYANSLGDSRYVDFASAFNFDPKGLVKVDGDGVQRPAAQLSTQNLYLLTTLEQQVGEDSTGTRLALYFRRKAPEITSPLKILADSALVKVATTALSLPDSFSQLDIDRQVSILESKLKVADLQDPKKLDQFISRFAALYDLANTDLTQSSPALGLFSGQGSTGLLGLF